MDVISFTTLFLGLVAGTHPVAVAVTAPVAAVELRLDGATLGSIRRQPPWTFRCDFGSKLRPHRLEAVALDRDGHAIGSCSQMVNMPRHDAEATIAVERGPSGTPREATVSWESLEYKEPESIQATLDGVPLKAAAPGRFELPALAMEKVHFLTAKVGFPRATVATAEMVFGGANPEAASADLTAVPVVARDGASLRGVADFEGAFTRDGRTLRAVAVEEGAANVIVVCDASAAYELSVLEGRRPYMSGTRTLGSLSAEDGVRFVLTVPNASRNRGRLVALFDTSQRFSAEDGGVPWLLMTAVQRSLVRDRQAIADAVAVAGLNAAGQDTRRAVVLVVGRGVDDRSTYDTADVRGFLERLRVPLFVWSLVRPDRKSAVKTWGPAEDASSVPAMLRAVERLRSSLAAQRIVWLEGQHLPDDVTLSDSFPSLALAGVGGPPH